MRKFLTLLLLFLFFGLKTAAAKQAVEIYYGETYYCGDSLEVIIQDEPQTTSMIARNPGKNKIAQLTAGKNQTILEVHMKVRNTSNIVYNGLSPESFKLVGYVRNHPITYLPEIMEPFDYGPKEHYRMYDKMYYKDQPFAPLRKIDMILAYRINPIVRDLEIHINPKGTDGEVQTYLNGTWGEMDLEPCDGIFQIVTIRDAETNEITKFYR